MENRRLTRNVMLDRKLLPALAIAASLAPSPLFAASPKRDSLEALKVIITDELEGKGKIIILRDRRLADSLIRIRPPLERERFNRIIGDTALAAEVKTREEFRAYWKKLEESHGFKDLRGQYVARNIDRARIPKLFLYDSSVVIYPGWIILRRK